MGRITSGSGAVDGKAALVPDVEERSEDSIEQQKCCKDGDDHGSHCENLGQLSICQGESCVVGCVGM